MALSFSYKDIENSEEVCLEQALDAQGKPLYGSDGEPEMKLRSVTDALIWSTMWIGIAAITSSNYRKFYARLRLYNDLFGPAVSTSTAPDVYAVSAVTGDGRQYLVGSMRIDSAVQFCRKYYVETAGGQDDPDFWSDSVIVGQEGFEIERHRSYYVHPEGETGELSFCIEGSELLAHRIETDSIDLEVVKSHIGLTTNASTKTDAEFRKMIYNNLMASAEEKIAVEIGNAVTS